MENIERVHQLLQVVEKIANPSYQQRVWLLGDGPEFDSWAETLCQFFDDFQADLLLNNTSESLGISPSQHTRSKAFRELLDRFARKYPQFVRDDEILMDPEWATVTQAAKDLLSEFGR